MISSSSRPERGLLLVRYTGAVTRDESEKWVETAAALLEKAPARFRLLVDMTPLTSMDVACAPSIERVMDMCQQHGVTDIIRIIPDPSRDIGMQIMSTFHYAPSVRIGTCSTPEEAVALLAGSDKADQEAIRALLAYDSRERFLVCSGGL